MAFVKSSNCIGMLGEAVECLTALGMHGPFWGLNPCELHAIDAEFHMTRTSEAICSYY